MIATSNVIRLCVDFHLFPDNTQLVRHLAWAGLISFSRLIQ
jgi:hypothetical protein